MAKQRLQYLKQKMDQNHEQKHEYATFINDMIENDFYKKVALFDISKPSCCISHHHGVYHRIKKKVRAVFDCSAKHNEKSINDSLLTGPDLINNRHHKSVSAVQG